MMCVDDGIMESGCYIYNAICVFRWLNSNTIVMEHAEDSTGGLFMIVFEAMEKMAAQWGLLNQ